ncbi:MAG: sugar phosphate isomerase/epimerase family protein [Victivallales bacterium]
MSELSNKTLKSEISAKNGHSGQFRDIPLYYCYSWEAVPDKMIPNIFAEFKANGADHLVFSYIWAERILREPAFFPPLMTMAGKAGVKLGAIHAPWGAAFDLNCSDMARRQGMVSDHKLMMAYAVEAGCKTYTMHVGAYSWVLEHVPLGRLRSLALDALEKLLPEAEKLGIVIAVENSYEPPNSAAEVAALVKHFDSPHIGCCFDTGHACLMAPFPGKDPGKYFREIPDAWWQGLIECPDSFDIMKPYIKTVHMHDNDGYSDAHQLPGIGRIDWREQMKALESCPGLVSLQTEVRTVPEAVPVRTLVETFQGITENFKAAGMSI